MTNTYREQVPDGKFHHRMHRQVDGIKLGFEWHGGQYIEVCIGDAFRSPHEVINVWDSVADGPRIPRTVRGMTAAVEDWIANYGENGEADLAHDVRVNW